MTLTSISSFLLSLNHLPPPPSWQTSVKANWMTCNTAKKGNCFIILQKGFSIMKENTGLLEKYHLKSSDKISRLLIWPSMIVVSVPDQDVCRRIWMIFIFDLATAVRLKLSCHQMNLVLNQPGASHPISKENWPVQCTLEYCFSWTPGS